MNTNTKDDKAEAKTNAEKERLSLADKVAQENAEQTSRLPPNEMQSPDQRRAAQETRDAANREPDPVRRQRHPMEVVDIIVRKHGHGSKPGEGIAFLLRSVAAQQGIQSDAFNAKIDDDAE